MFKEAPMTRYLRLAFSGSVAGLALAATPALAQSTAANSDIQQGERVEVTGSSIKRIDAESALPVQVLTRSDIDHLAPSSTADLLRTISATNTAGATQVSTGAGATTGGLSGVSIHSLGENRTLVLVNGLRVASFGGAQGATNVVDVNSIPVAAIERVEVLRDGASAIYGSDAIAGVVNFILRNDYQGALIEGQYRQSSHSGDGKQYDGDVVLGYGDIQKDKFNAMLVASFNREDAIFGRQRNFANTTVFPDVGADGSSGNTYPADVVISSGAARNFLAPFYAGQVASGRYPTFGFTNCAPGITSSSLFGATGQRNCRYDPGSAVDLIPESERSSLQLTGRYAITPNIEAYAEAGANHVVNKYLIQATPISDAFVLNATDPYTPQLAALLRANQAALTRAYGAAFYNSLFGKTDFLLPTTSPYYPTNFAADNGLAGSPIDLRYRSVESGGRAIRDVNDSDRFVAGVRGNAYNFDYDFSGLYTQGRVTETLTGGYPQYSLILPLLNSGLVNPFGPSSPAIQQQLAAANYYGTAYQTHTSLLGFQGHVSRELYTLPAGPITGAIGGEARREQYKLDASTAIQSGDLSGYGGNFLNENAYRNVEAGYLEFNVPIVKGLELDAAGRYDNYEHVGNTFNPKASLRWQPAKEFLLRGSWGTGFRAPSLAESNAPQTLGVTGVLTDPVRCPDPTLATSVDCTVQFSQLNGGNPRLTPEKSISKTAGFIIEPTENVHVGLDWFDTFVRNEIVIGGVAASTILGNLDKYAYLVTRDPATGRITQINQTNTNLFNAHVTGVDIDLRFRLPTEYGRFTAALNGTYLQRFDQQNDDGSYTGIVGNAFLAGTDVPRWKHIATLAYDRGPYFVQFQQNFQSAYLDYGGDRRVGVYETYDIAATYTGIKHVGVTLGIKNIADRDPPQSYNNGAQFQGGYDASYAEVRGRAFYAKLSYSYK